MSAPPVPPLAGETGSSPQRRKKISESKRRRDVFRYCPQELRGFDLSALLETSPNLAVPPPGFVPAPSPDPALNTFAQLGAIRLGASRALISLLDGHHQFILAEATPSLSIRSDRHKDAVANQLWLGNVRIPRSKGVCEMVLNVDPLDPGGTERSLAIVIDDMAENESLAQRSYVTGYPKWRFYAGVPLVSPDGAVIGAFCIFDDKPRDGLTVESLELLHDMAATVVEHLATYKFKEENSRGEQMIRGLTSFLAGASSLQKGQSQQKRQSPQKQHKPWMQRPPLPSMLTSSARVAYSPSPSPAVEAEKFDFGSLPIRDKQKTNDANLDVNLKAKAVQEPRPHAQRAPKSASSDLQESILPPNARSLFSRAANIIRETSQLDGVVIFDASIAGFGGQRQRSPLPSSPTHSSEERTRSFVTEFQQQHGQDTSSSDSSGPTRGGDRQRCQILGFSSADESSINGDTASLGLQSLTEQDLKKLLKNYSKGKILNFGMGEATTSSDESAKDDLSDEEFSSVPMRRSRKREGMSRVMTAIQLVAPGARSVCFLPLWDYESSRWFVGCLFWTTQEDRLLSPSLDLVYLKAFGNSVMTELSRLHEVSSNRTKTTFAASISHELRSPLHGILGGIEFLQNTTLDSFQMAMLHSVSTCGRTLLDTLNHVMDYGKLTAINSEARSHVQVMAHNSVRISSRPRRSQKLAKIAAELPSTLDLSLVTEEVVEAVFASQSYRTSHNSLDHSSSTDTWTTPSSNPTSPGPSQKLLAISTASRKLVLVVLDIPYEDNWRFDMPVGAWRRIVMNIFGNALKYTESGYIVVSLRASPSPSTTSTTIVLSVKDTGIGISPDFLANRLYAAFSQENPLSSGVGLGLNIVRQLVESVGGTIDLTSDLDAGTEVSVSFSLSAGKVEPERGQGDEEMKSLERICSRMKGKEICILDRADGSDNSSLRIRGARNFSSTLTNMLTGWLGMRVTTTSQWQGHHAEFVICTEPSFEYLASIRSTSRRLLNDDDVQTKAPVTIFLAIDAIEAAALRSDARITSKESVVEIITQPCGPNKLAMALDHCMNRYQSVNENIPSAMSSENVTPNIVEKEQWPQVHEGEAAAIPRLKMNGEGDFPLTVKDDEKQKLHILIVDDNVINRRLLVAMMRKHAFTYGEAQNGLEALNLYKETQNPRFNIILMDLSMPIMDGMTSTHRIRKYERENRISRTTIVALTGLASASARLEALQSGVDFYMTKPVNFKRLMDLIGSEESEVGRTKGQE